MFKIKIQWKNTNKEPNKHGPLQKLEVRWGAIEELASSTDQTRNNPQTITSLIIVSNNYEKRP